jgi:protein-export membrane protein SecD/preprotein translocase SecF subunit
MIRRFLVIGLICCTAFVLMGLQNWFLTGHQDFQADIQNLPDRVVEIRLNDLAGTQVSFSDIELEQLRQRIAGDAAAKLPPLQVVADSLAVTPEGRVRLTLAEGQDPQTARNRLAGKPYRRANESRHLFAVNLGIDLRGGVEFICRLYNDDGMAVPADEETLHTLRKRLDARGLTEPVVTRLSNGDVQITIPGGTRADAAATRKVLQSTGRLEFRELKAELQRSQIVPLPNNRWGLAKDAGVHQDFGDVVYPKKPEIAGDEPTAFQLLGKVALTGAEVANAYQTLQDGQLAVGIEFTARGGAMNEDFTGRVKALGDQGKGSGRIAISLDGFIESDPRIMSPSGRNTVISGRFTSAEVEALRTVLKAGSLKVNPVVMSERVVGPTLGAETVSKATIAMILSALCTVLFMPLWYRRIGFVALGSLAVGMGLLYAVLVMFGATLTLPGIAGLVLTIGMAIDGNILIFERIREELDGGKDLKSAIDAGYDRAFITIFDGNVTTAITAIILYWVGSGPVQGFGLTLLIGLATTMFGAVYVGRAVTDLLYRKQETGVVPNPLKGFGQGVSYVKLRFAAFIFSGALLIAGTLEFFVFTPLNNNFDIDFTGGNAVQVTFTQPKDLAAVRAGLERVHAEGFEAKSVQVQPYFSSFAERGASRQWVFKARDVHGASIEVDRQQLEMRMAELRRQEAAAHDEKSGDKERAKVLARKIETLRVEMQQKNALIDQRVKVFADQLRQGFGADIPADGSEIVAASWNDRVVELAYSTLDPVQPDQARLLAEGLKRLPGVTATRASGEGNLLKVNVTWAVEPQEQRQAPLGDIGARLVQLLANGSATSGDPRLYGRATATTELNDQISMQAANHRIRIAKPVPSSEHFSGTVAGRMKLEAAIAMGLALLGILAYVAARFEFRFGVGAVIALFHDVPITMGVLALLGMRIDMTVVAALLTIIGYSINDTIVVYDRIREILQKYNKSMAETIDLAVGLTMSRTVLTGGTTLASCAALYFFGGDGVANFAFALFIGIAFGTYSSIFVAAPILLLLDRKGNLARQVKAEVAPEEPTLPK